MKSLLLCVNLLSLCCVVLGTCPVNFQSVKMYCFHFSKTPETFFAAWNSCKQIDGNLISIEDPTKMLALIDYLSPQHTNLSRSMWWIGLSDLAEANVWKWVSTGRTIAFADWCTANPHYNDYYNQCAEITNTNNKCWQDAPCSKPTPYICEAPQLYNDEPPEY